VVSLVVFATWLVWRQNLFADPARFDLAVSDEQIEIRSGVEAIARFTERFRYPSQDGDAEHGAKEIELRRDGSGRFRIVREDEETPACGWN
jgi:hypothetical protein